MRSTSTKQPTVSRVARLALAGASLCAALYAPSTARAQRAPAADAGGAPVAAAVHAPSGVSASPSMLRVSELLDPNTPPPPRPERPQAAPRVGPWVLMGVGGGSLLSSLVLFVLHNQAMAGCGFENSVLTCASAADVDRARTAPTFEAASWGAATGGFVSITGGFIWWFARRAPPPVNTAFAPLPGGGSLLVGGRF